MLVFAGHAKEKKETHSHYKREMLFVSLLSVMAVKRNWQFV
jgi:hypothetical protein